MKLDVEFKNFTDVGSIDSEVTTMLAETKRRQKTENLVFRLFNMKDLMTKEEAEQKRVRDRTNHGDGYATASSMKSQIASIYSKNKKPINMRFSNDLVDDIEDYATIKQFVEAHMPKELNETIVKSRRLERVFGGLSKRLPLLGKAHLVFPNRNDWCPELRELMIPAGTGKLASDVPYAVSIGYMNINELRPKSTLTNSYWDTDAVKDSIEGIEFATKQGGSMSPSQSVEIGDQTIQMTEHIQEESDLGTNRKGIIVYHLYEVDHTKPEMPVSYTVIAKHIPSYCDKKKKDTGKYPDRILYHSPKEFDRVEHWLHPIYMDASIDSAETMNSVKGFGEIIYNTVLDLSTDKNELRAGVKEYARPKYMVANNSDMQMIQKYAGSNLLPEGLTLAPMNQAPNFQAFYGVISSLEKNIAMNANSSITNQARGNQELMAQAQQRQSMADQVMQSHMDEIYNGLDGVKREIVRRFFHAKVQGSSKGGREISKFRNKMEKKDIDFKKIGELEDGEFVYLDVLCTRSATNGSSYKEQRVTGHLIDTMKMRSEEARKEALTELDKIALDDPDLIERVNPAVEKVPVDQIDKAEGENAAMMMNAPTGYVAPLGEDDIIGIHLARHFARQESLLLIAQNDGWTTLQVAEFQLNQEHCMLHIQELDRRGDDQLKQEAMNKLAEYQRASGEFIANLQQQMEAKGGEDKEAAKMQMEMDKLVLKERQEDRLAQGQQANFGMKQEKQQFDMLAKQELLKQNADNVAINKARVIKELSEEKPTQETNE